MSSQIIGLTDWLKTPPGEYLLDWERERFDLALSDVFGYHALQLGLPEIDALRANRMPHQWVALDAPATTSTTESVRQVALLTHSVALPFAANSLDLVVLPHTLELSLDPHATLREVERVLVPELNMGQLVWLLRARVTICSRKFRKLVFSVS